jgi:hypothetical protein
MPREQCGISGDEPEKRRQVVGNANKVGLYKICFSGRLTFASPLRANVSKGQRSGTAKDGETIYSWEYNTNPWTCKSPGP